jgi:hypothetical protein
MRNLLLLGLAGVGAYCLYKGYLKKETKDVLGAAKEGAQDLVNVVLPENTSAASGVGSYLGDSIVGNNCYCGKDCGTITAKNEANCNYLCSTKCNRGAASGGGKGFGFKRRMAVRPSNGHPMFG